MRSVTSESQSRQHYVENLVAETRHNLLDNDSVANRLDTDMRATLLSLTEAVFVPNIKNGIATIPKSYQGTDATPVIPAKRTEVVRLGEGFGTMTTQQQAAVERQDTPLRFNKHLRAMLTLLGATEGETDNNKGIAQLNLGAYVTAVICLAQFKYFEPHQPMSKLTTERMIIGKPAIVLLANREHEFEPTINSSAGLVHELVHVNQMHHRPLRPLHTDAAVALKDDVANELEAYRHAGWYERGLFESNDDPYAGNDDVYHHAIIESRRLKCTSKEKPYEPTQELVDLLVELGAVGHTRLTN